MAKYRMAFDSIDGAKAFLESGFMKFDEDYEIHVVFENDRLERVRSRKEPGAKRRKKAISNEALAIRSDIEDHVASEANI